MALFGSANQYRPQSSTGGSFAGPAKKPLSFQQAYPAAVEQTGEDYSGIMKGYQDILSNAPRQNANLMSRYEQILNQPSSASQFSPITAEQQEYSQDPNVAASIGKLKEYTDTGGLGGSEIQELRARGVSPIRAIYANAMRNADRQRSLSGGYSPNAGASSARMARELSEQIAGQTSNVNAGIAEMQQRGRLGMAGQFADASAREAGAKRNIDSSNVGARNRANEINLQGRTEANRFGADERTNALTAMERLSNPTSQLAALSGMQSLYGTTPALASTFGNQAMGAAQLQQQATNQNNQTGQGLISSYLNRPQSTSSVFTPALNTSATNLNIAANPTTRRRYSLG